MKLYVLVPEMEKPVADKVTAALSSISKGLQMRLDQRTIVIDVDGRKFRNHGHLDIVKDVVYKGSNIGVCVFNSQEDLNAWRRNGTLRRVWVS